MSNFEKMKCRICGKTFVAEYWKAKYCSYECKQDARKQRKKQQIEELRHRMDTKKLTIEDINELALAEHLSYGQFVAKYKI